MPAEYSRSATTPPRSPRPGRPFRSGAVLAAGVWKAFRGFAAGVGRPTVPTDGRSAGVFARRGDVFSAAPRIVTGWESARHSDDGLCLLQRRWGPEGVRRRALPCRDRRRAVRRLLSCHLERACARDDRPRERRPRTSDERRVSRRGCNSRAACSAQDEPREPWQSRAALALARRSSLRGRQPLSESDLGRGAPHGAASSDPTEFRRASLRAHRESLMP